MNLSPDNFFDAVYEKAIEQKTFSTLEEKRKYVCEGLRHSLGNFSNEFGQVPLTQPTILEKVIFDDYIREKVVFETAENLQTSMYILTPKDDRDNYPAVLALHGHGYGNKEIVGLTETGKEDYDEPGIHQHFAVQLVKRGLKVFAPEVIGFGDRLLSKDIEDGKPSSCDLMVRSLLMVGKTLAGLRVAEAIRVIDIIETFPDVKENRIGIMGFSGGGLIAAYTALLDKRIQATVLCGFTNTFKGSVLSIRHCIDNYVPGLLNIAELPELISFIAPRPLFVESGKQDPIFPVAHFKIAVSEIGTVFNDIGAHNEFDYDLFDGGHQINGRKSYDWLKEHLI